MKYPVNRSANELSSEELIRIYDGLPSESEERAELRAEMQRRMAGCTRSHADLQQWGQQVYGLQGQQLGQK